METFAPALRIRIEIWPRTRCARSHCEVCIPHSSFVFSLLAPFPPSVCAHLLSSLPLFLFLLLPFLNSLPIRRTHARAQISCASLLPLYFAKPALICSVAASRCHARVRVRVLVRVPVRPPDAGHGLPFAHSVACPPFDASSFLRSVPTARARHITALPSHAALDHEACTRAHLLVERGATNSGTAADAHTDGRAALPPPPSTFSFSFAFSFAFAFAVHPSLRASREGRPAPRPPLRRLPPVLPWLP